MLDIYQRAEIDEFYDGTYASVRQISQIMKISPMRIRYYVNEKYRQEQTVRARNWMNTHPEKVQIISRRACKKYYHFHREQEMRRHKEWALKNPEKYRFICNRNSRKYYLEHKEKILANKRARYRKLKSTR